MGVPLYNFAELHNDQLKKDVLKRFENILSKNAYIEGEYNQSFEKRFAEKQGAKYCLMVANGTDALEIALQAYDIGPGKKVGVANISFYASAECVINRGAEIVFVDVDPDTGLICPKSLERTIKQHKLDAIIPVHIYGMPAPIEELEKICKPHNIKIVEDGAQAQGGRLENGKPIGSSDNLTTFSFYPTKNLGGMGDGGAILTNSDELATKITSIRNHGRSPNGHALVGRNSRCDSFQAAVLDLKLDNIDQLSKQRTEVAGKYNEILSSSKAKLMPKRYLNLSSWHMFPILAKDKDEQLALCKHLNENNIGATASFYPKSLPEELPIKDFPGEKENAVQFASRCICLPMNPFLKDADIQEVAQQINSFYL